MKNQDYRLHYDLRNPNYSIYHRAALGGLASTIKAWGRDRPADISCKVSESAVCVTWPDELQDTEALKRILSWSFRLSDDKLIDMPGQRFADRKDLQVLNHYCMLETFLQHPLTRRCETRLRTLSVDMGGNELPLYLQYKAVTQYAHQIAAGTKLLTTYKNGKFPLFAQITQPMIPGVLDSGHSIRCTAEDGILLLFVSVACSLFILRPMKQDQSQRFGIIIPEVTDLQEFCSERKRLNSSAPFKTFYTNSYEGRVVGTIQEAGLKLILDKRSDANHECTVRSRGIVMGMVPWDKYQRYRVSALTIDAEMSALNQFNKVSERFKRCVNIMDANFNTFLFPASFMPSLIAENVLEKCAWYHNIDRCMDESQDSFEHLLTVSNVIQTLRKWCTRDESALIRMFHEAWASLLRRDHAEGYRRTQNRNHSLRIAVMQQIMRAKSKDQVIDWFMDFVNTNSNNSSHEKRIELLRICKWWHNQVIFEDVRALLLVALLTCSKTAR